MTNRFFSFLSAPLFLALPLQSGAARAADIIFAGEAYAMQRTALTADYIFNELWGETSNLFPFETVDGKEWKYSAWSAWPAGFFAGVLWHYADLTGSQEWEDRARQMTTALSGWTTQSGDHDIGFNLLTTFARGYDITGLDSDREAVVTAANTFSSGHWMPAVGSLWSFNFNWGPSIRPAGSSRVQGGFRQRQNVIIDTSMNIELLFLAARLGGDIELWNRGLSHMQNVIRDLVREDGGTIQIVDYHLTDQYSGGELIAEAGDVRGTYAWQGYSKESTWSRGQGWALHGLASAYRETGDPTILEGLLRVADYYLRGTPEDGVPYWDYDAGTIDDQGWLDFYADRDLFARDTSAAAIAAAGLLELSRLLDDPAERHRYFDYAERILVSLSTPEAQGGYLSKGTVYESILTQGTYTFSGYEKGLTWGDFYYIQALQRYREIVAPPARWSADAVAGATERWARVPDHVWTVRSHAARTALGTTNGLYTTALHSEMRAAALLDTAVAGDLEFLVEVAAAENLALRPNASALIFFNWTNEDNYHYFKLSAAAGDSGIYERAGGIETQITSVPSPLLPNYSWSSVAFSRSGTQHSFSVNGNLVTSISLPLSEGLMGLGSDGDSVFFSEVSLDAVLPPESYTEWAAINVADPGLRGPADDANADGVANLFYYVASADPSSQTARAGGPLAMELRLNEKDLALDFQARARSDYKVIAEYSSDLDTWETIEPRFVPNALPDIRGRRSMDVNVSERPYGFLRLRAEPRQEAP